MRHFRLKRNQISLCKRWCEDGVSTWLLAPMDILCDDPYEFRVLKLIPLNAESREEICNKMKIPTPEEDAGHRALLSVLRSHAELMKIEPNLISLVHTQKTKTWIALTHEQSEWLCDGDSHLIVGGCLAALEVFKFKDHEMRQRSVYLSLPRLAEIFDVNLSTTAHPNE